MWKAERLKVGAMTSMLVLGVVLTIGCASKGFVRDEVSPLHDEHRDLESNLEKTQARLMETDERLTAKLGRQEEDIDGVSKTAQEALDRALEAGKLAEGKLLYETVLSDGVLFGFENTELTDEAATALDDLGTRLAEKNDSVYLEIQGHTDASGPEEYNQVLGEERAESVRRYLNMKHQIPLHRMATISYGEDAPLADNATRDGRAQNRRVVVVVLQ